MFALSKLSKLFTRSAAPPFDDLGSFSVFFPWPILAYLGLSSPRPPRPPRPGVLARPEVMSLEDDLGTTVAEAAISLCIRSTPW